MTIECDCSAPDAGDENVIYRARMVRGRRDYTCCECGEVIPAGVRHEYVTLMTHWHEWASYRTCAPCRAIRERYCPRGFFFGRVAEQIEDCIGFDYRVVPEDEEDEE